MLGERAIPPGIDETDEELTGLEPDEVYEVAFVSFDDTEVLDRATVVYNCR